MRPMRIVTVVLCLLSAGCNPKFEKDSNGQDGPLTVQSSGMDEFVQSRVMPSEEPEKYFVYFGWPRIEDKKRIRIRTDRQLALVYPSQVSFSHKADHNQTLTYFFEILDDANRVERSFSKLVVIPRDFVVREGTNQIFEPTRLRIQRLFISSVPFITNGNDLDVVADELHAEDGVIESFEENTKAAEDQPGRSGGKLLIKATTATGSLAVHMRGENGGDGSKGIAWETRAAAGRAAGQGGEYTCLGGSQTRGAGDQKCWCTSTGEDATDGSAGAIGRQGNPGARGGNSGNLRIEVKDGREFLIQVSKTPGKPGAPGPGGEGQLGGLGGDGDHKASVKDCRGHAGKTGIDGQRGPKGIEGFPGADEPLCIYIASEARNECL